MMRLQGHDRSTAHGQRLPGRGPFPWAQDAHRSKTEILDDLEHHDLGWVFTGCEHFSGDRLQRASRDSRRSST